jgi:anti-sigma B factor antagonist
VAITIAERPEYGVTVVEIIGELDLDSAPMLRAVLGDLVDRDVTRIVLDAAALRFCDSIGLSVLLTTHRACVAIGGFLRLAAPPDFLLTLLAVVGLAEHVPAYRSVDAAGRGDDTQLVSPPRRDDLPPRTPPLLPG